MRRFKALILENLKSIIFTVIVVGFFILSSWVSREYAAELAASAFADNQLGMLAYITVSAASVVAAGLSSSPLIPLAAALWGTAATVALTTVGWTVGALAAFWLARKYGEALVCRIVNKCDIEDYSGKIKVKGLFWRLLVARIFLPVDIISYVIGLFSRMSWWSFGLATLIGSSIFTILAIYGSGLIPEVQAVIGLIMLAGLIYWARRSYQTIFFDDRYQ